MVRRRRYGVRRYWTRRYRGRYYGRYQRGDSGDSQGAYNPINYGNWRGRGRPRIPNPELARIYPPSNPIKGGFGYPYGSTRVGGFVKMLGYGFSASGGYAPLVRGYSLD